MKNLLKVSGSFAELDRFSKQASGPDSCLDPNRFIPYPKLFEVLDELNKTKLYQILDIKMSDEEIEFLTLARLNGLDIHRTGYYQGGYDWCMDNWGFSKMIHSSLLWKKRTIHYMFDTSWYSPAKLVKAMGKQFPKLFFTLESNEAFSGFRGQLKIAGGEVISEREKG